MRSEIRNPQSAIRNAFTLVELLVVISIILLLAGILLPMIIRAKELAYRTTTRAYITQLEGGALRYQQEHQYFPGQENTGILGGGNDHYTASQVLGATLFGVNMIGDGEIDYYKDADDKDVPPTSEYVQYKAENVINENVEEDDDLAFAPKDLFPGKVPKASEIGNASYFKADSFPLLYYPSLLGNDGSIIGSYATSNNATLTLPNDDEDVEETTTNITHAYLRLVWDRRFGEGDSEGDPPIPDTDDHRNKIYNSDTFMIFSKGLDDRDRSASYFSEQSSRNF